MRSPILALLLAATLPLTDCQIARDLAFSSNTVALEPVAGTGVSLSKIKVRPSTTTVVSAERGEIEKKQLRLVVEGSVTAAQPAGAQVAARLACEVRGLTMSDSGVSFLPLGKRKPGDALDREIALDLGPAVDAPFDKCELEISYVQRSNNLAEPPTSTVSLGKLCYLDGTLTVGACAAGTLPREGAGAKPTVADLTGKFDRNPPEGKGGMNPPPGKPRQKFRFRFTHRLQRGTNAFPADGHRVIGHCQTAAGVERRGIGSPSQGNGIAPGEWQTLEQSWYFMDEPRACDVQWVLGGGSLTPRKGPPVKREAFARYCVTPTAVTEGACKPAIVPSD